MTATGTYAARYGRVLLADPGRRREVFTAAKARGDEVRLVGTPRTWWVYFRGPFRVPGSPSAT